jgi:hypothetical protein
MVAESVDAVIGGDTHRDTHALAMTAPHGARIATPTINNNASGFAEALPGSPIKRPALASSSDSRAPAVMESDALMRSAVQASPSSRPSAPLAPPASRKSDPSMHSLLYLW